MEKLEIDYIKQFFKKRMPNSHKGDFGHALLIAGSKQKMGAAIIAAKACLRSGAGLLTVSIPIEERSSIFSFIPEAMLHFRDDQIDFSKYNNIAIGPGLGQDSAAQKLLFSVLLKANYPIVIDADALNIISQLSDNEVAKIDLSNSIITPHPKEAARLLNDSTDLS